MLALTLILNSKLAQASDIPTQITILSLDEVFHLYLNEEISSKELVDTIFISDDALIIKSRLLRVLEISNYINDYPRKDVLIANLKLELDKKIEDFNDNNWSQHALNASALPIVVFSSAFLGRLMVKKLIKNSDELKNIALVAASASSFYYSAEYIQELRSHLLIENRSNLEDELEIESE